MTLELQAAALKARESEKALIEDGYCACDNCCNAFDPVTWNRIMRAIAN